MDIEDFVDALNFYHDSRAEMLRAMATCDEDADYFCAHQIARHDRARADLGDVLNQLIDARIEAHRVNAGGTGE